MPKKTPRRKKQIQISDDDTPDQRKNNRQAQNEARQLRALNRNRAGMAMNQNDPALLNGVVDDDQQRQVPPPVRRTLGDYTTPRVTGFQSAIAPPGIEANTWELKTGLIQMVQNSQFSGRINEDPHQHLKRFVQMCNTVKTNGVPSESYYLRLFPFSLSDKASRWLDSHAEGTFTTWNRLAEAFLQQYFPPSKTAHFRNKIISFRSIDGETLYDAWERYKELTRMCPHHNLEQWQIIDTFYQGIDQGMRTLINQAAGNPRDRKGVQDLCQAESTNDIARLADSMKILATEMQNMKLANSMKSSDVAHIGVYCQICGSPSHYADGCPVIGSDNDGGTQEDANFVGQINQGTGFGNGSAGNRWDNPNRNHPNLSYKPQNQAPMSFPYKQQQGNAPYQPRGQYNVRAQEQNNNSYQPKPQYNNQLQGQQNQNSGSYSYQPQQPKQQETSESSGLETMMAKFMADQERRAQEADKRAQEADKRAQEQERRVKELGQTIRMIGNQVAQQADSAHREPGKLPSKPEHHPRESVNAITLRGGKQLEMIPAQTSRNPAAKSALNSALDEEETSQEAENREENSVQTVEPAPYKPPVPYPQRLKGARRDKEFMKFVDKIRALYITMPFTDAITQIPTYAKFMKEIMTGKRKMDGTETVALSEECSAAMHVPMPPKRKDSGSFSIPCDIGGITIHRALCDLGASVSIMPYSLYSKLNLGDLCPTNISICLADHSCRLPKGILKDVPVKVKNIYIPADFIVLEISEDTDIPIFLGRPFLYTARVVIDMDRGSIALRVGSEHVVFYLPDMCRTPSLLADCDVLDSADVDQPISLTSIESYKVVPGCPIPMDVYAVSIEGADAADAAGDAGKESCTVELKPLPASLRYEFLGPNSTYPVIVNASLTDVETQKLLDVLRKHRPALGYSIDDLKGISPDLCMHRINLEDDARPSRDALRRLNPKLNDVVKKEILKLLDAGIIYSVADSKWVSPVHVVPKKGGLTIVRNEQNELIPTRTVTGWRMCIDYRKLNKATLKDHFPLPFIDQMLERLAKHKFFCYLDGYSGFFQIPIHPEDQEKTTFTCPFGTFAYRHMPFGLCNAPATFQRCMMAIFSDFLEHTMEVFMDDFSVYGSSFDSCLSNLADVLVLTLTWF
ncbi:unnamed protein product [Rhodiola kirilowii]